MCTVTFIARQKGYALGMNRDEQRSRVEALPPSIQRLGERSAVYPFEPRGGTWIGVNDLGITFALINWYAVRNQVTKRLVTRGKVVIAALESVSLDSTGQLIRSLPLSRMNPFRLIGVFPHVQDVIEWRWNREDLRRISHGWTTNAWFSSGFDEPGVQVARRKTFSTALGQKSCGKLEWLRRLHRSHEPEKGAYSICMHRDDAATMSYSEVIVASHRSTMMHLSAPPCEYSCTAARLRSNFSLELHRQRS